VYDVICKGGCGKTVWINPAFEATEDSEWCVGCYVTNRAALKAKCECGAKAAGTPWHADYCPRYGKDAPQHPRKLSTTPAKEDENDTRFNRDPDFEIL
jgi:hypothetical protein